MDLFNQIREVPATASVRSERYKNALAGVGPAPEQRLFSLLPMPLLRRFVRDLSAAGIKRRMAA